MYFLFIGLVGKCYVSNFHTYHLFTTVYDNFSAGLPQCVNLKVLIKINLDSLMYILDLQVIIKPDYGFDGNISV